jgi:hypothetical protein
MAKYSYQEFINSLNYLEAEGYIEKFLNEKGDICYRICEGAENCDV